MGFRVERIGCGVQRSASAFRWSSAFRERERDNVKEREGRRGFGGEGTGFATCDGVHVQHLPREKEAWHLLEFRAQGLGFIRVWGLGFRVQGSWFTVQGSGFRVPGLGCGVQGSGFGVSILGFRV